MYAGVSREVTILHILIQYQRRVIVSRDEEDYQRISIRRPHLFKDALRAFSKPSFNVGKILKVKFIGEAATVDDGGPRREFFSLLIKEIFLRSGLFFGWPSNVVVVQNIQALSANQYVCVPYSRWSITFMLLWCGCRLLGASKREGACYNNGYP